MYRTRRSYVAGAVELCFAPNSQRWLGVMLWRSESPRPLPAGIAVLPFENLSADPENTFSLMVYRDEILNDLAKIADLRVISRTSVMQYKSGAKRNLRQIANELGVAHVVEGSGQRAQIASGSPRS